MLWTATRLNNIISRKYEMKKNSSTKLVSRMIHGPVDDLWLNVWKRHVAVKLCNSLCDKNRWKFMNIYRPQWNENVRGQPESKVIPLIHLDPTDNFSVVKFWSRSTFQHLKTGKKFYIPDVEWYENSTPLEFQSSCCLNKEGTWRTQV